MFVPPERVVAYRYLVSWTVAVQGEKVQQITRVMIPLPIVLVKRKGGGG